MAASASSSVTITGMRELQAALARSQKELRTEVRAEFRNIAEPIRRDAQHLAESEITRMPFSPRWSKMRTGVTRTVVYVAPQQRGVKARGGFARRRPNLADLLMVRAMEPALHRNETQVEHEVENALDRIADHFN